MDVLFISTLLNEATKEPALFTIILPKVKVPVCVFVKVVAKLVV